MKIINTTETTISVKLTDGRIYAAKKITLFPSTKQLKGYLFTTRIDNEEFKDYHVYNLRHNGDWSKPATIENSNVTVNWVGTFITETELDFSQQDYIELPEESPITYGWD